MTKSQPSDATSQQTEDDTYLALVRPPFLEMRRLFSQWVTSRPAHSTGRAAERDEFLSKYHWTSAELVEAQRKYQIQMTVDKMEMLLRQQNEK